MNRKFADIASLENEVILMTTGYDYSQYYGTILNYRLYLHLSKIARE